MAQSAKLVSKSAVKICPFFVKALFYKRKPGFNGVRAKEDDITVISTMITEKTQADLSVEQSQVLDREAVFQKLKRDFDYFLYNNDPNDYLKDVI